MDGREIALRQFYILIPKVSVPGGPSSSSSLPGVPGAIIAAPARQRMLWDGAVSLQEHYSCPWTLEKCVWRIWSPTGGSSMWDLLLVSRGFFTSIILNAESALLCTTSWRFFFS